jgi:hypothetical protein
MKELPIEILNGCMLALPPWITDVMNKYPGKVIVAGGYIRAKAAGEEVKDIDLFVDSLETAKAIVPKGINITVTSTDNAITIRVPNAVVVQIITRWTYQKPEDVINSFDFTIAQACIWYDGEWKSLCSDTFLVDTKLKQLVYTSPVRDEDCAGSLNRIFKFVKRGYSVDAKNLSAVVARLCYKTYCEYDIDSRKNSEEFVAECIHREVAKSIGNRY